MRHTKPAPPGDDGIFGLKSAAYGAGSADRTRSEAEVVGRLERFV
ncbi:MAG TPA: hypothetical protein VN833_07985 [Candidatus Acidoferrales bacterium]|nr:hypothetical protein [Candidatus Acidoferrales bacterium]